MDESPKSAAPAFSTDDDARAVTKAHEIMRDGKRKKALRLHAKTLHRALGMDGKGRKSRKPRKARGTRRQMPLGKDSSRNIKELTHQCKVRGKFGTLPKMGRKRCFQAAKAAGLNAARRKSRKGKRSGRGRRS